VPGAVSVDTTPDGRGLMILDHELEILAITPNASAGSKTFRMSARDYRM
jgi:hypothetical protein